MTVIRLTRNPAKRKIGVSFTYENSTDLHEGLDVFFYCITCEEPLYFENGLWRCEVCGYELSNDEFGGIVDEAVEALKKQDPRCKLESVNPSPQKGRWACWIVKLKALLSS